MNKLLYLVSAISLLAISFLTSCLSDEENLNDTPDFSIRSTEYFEIKQRHSNGWIDDAVVYTYDSLPLYEINYHGNGQLASIKSYTRYPIHGVYLEHYRNERDQPDSSKLYDLNGKLYFSIKYNQGIPQTSTVYFNQYKLVSEYEEGRVINTEKFNSGGQLTKRISVDHTANQRTITLFEGGEQKSQVITSLSDDIMVGFSAGDHQFVGALFEEDLNLKTMPVRQSYFSSFQREYAIDFASEVPLTEYETVPEELKERFGYALKAQEAMNFANNPLYRSLVEQYSFIEAAYLGESIYFHEEVSADIPLGERIEQVDSLKEVYGDDFSEFFGDQYSRAYINGKLFYYIVVLRNLPTDENLREQIVNAARSYAHDIFNNTNNTTEGEKLLIDEVFFQLKVHSNVIEELNGKTIESQEEYVQIVETLDAQPNSRIRIDYTFY